jgi:hypothetical protein
VHEVSVLEISHAFVKKVSDVLVCYCRRKPPPMNVTYYLVALGCFNLPVCKGH